MGGNKPYFGSSSNSSGSASTSSSSLGMGSSHHNMSGSGMGSMGSNMSGAGGPYSVQDRAPSASMMGGNKMSSNSVGVSVTPGDNSAGPPAGHPQSSISRSTPQSSSRYLNPNAPNFPPSTKYNSTSSSAGTNPSAPPFMSSVQHQAAVQQNNSGKVRTI